MPNLTMSVLLKGIDQLTRPLRTITTGSTGAAKAIAATKTELQALNKTQRDIDGFRDLKTGTKNLGLQLADARAGAKRLKDEIAASENPTRKQARALATSEREVAKLSKRYTENMDKLRALRTRMEAAGVTTGNLDQHEKRLAASIATTNGRLATQQQRMERIIGTQKRMSAAKERYERDQGRAGKLAGAGAATLGAGIAVGAPTALAIKGGVDFEAQLRDMAITGGMSKADEQGLGNSVRLNATRWNAFTTDINKGLGVLVANGITGVSDLKVYGGLIAKTSVAANAATEDIGGLIYSLQTNLKVSAKDTAETLDGLAYSGKQGSFELKDMASWIPRLGPQMAALGANGRTAANDLAAALQVARLGAGTSDEAGNNLENFLNKITSNDAKTQFAKAGIDLQKEMTGLTAKGFGPIESMLKIAQGYIDKQDPKTRKQFAKAYAIGDDNDREAALKAMSGNFSLGKLFTDAQVRAFLLPALANQGQYKEIREGSNGASGTLDKDWSSRMETREQQFVRLQVQAQESGFIVDGILKPALQNVLERLGKIVDQINAWAAANPGLARTMVYITAALAVLLTVVGALMIAVAAFLGPLAILRVSLAVLGIQGGVFMTILRALAGVFTGPLATALRFIGTTILFVGRAMMANPILALVGLLAIAAFAIYENWGPIKEFFLDLWGGISKALSSAWDAISDTFNSGVAYVRGKLQPLIDLIGRLTNAWNTLRGKTDGAIAGNLPPGMAQLDKDAGGPKIDNRPVLRPGQRAGTTVQVAGDQLHMTITGGNPNDNARAVEDMMRRRDREKAAAARSNYEDHD